MHHLTRSTITVQTIPESLPSTPAWMADVAACAQLLTQTVLLPAVTERVRCARARMGTDELIDGVVGSALCGEPTMHAFDACLHPFAVPFRALCGRSRSALLLGAVARVGISGTCAHPVLGRPAGPHAMCESRWDPRIGVSTTD